MNTMLFWDPKEGVPIRIKVTQRKEGLWRGPTTVSPAGAKRLAIQRGWEHVTTKTKRKLGDI